MIILETYTTLKGGDLKLPDFLDIVEEVTKDPKYSMYNLSRIDAEAASPSADTKREFKLAQIASIKGSPMVNGHLDENEDLVNGKVEEDGEPLVNGVDK